MSSGGSNYSCDSVSALHLGRSGSSSSNESRDFVTKGVGRTSYLGFLIKDAIFVASYSREKSETSTIMQIDPHTICTKVGEPVDRLFWAQCQLWKTQNNRALPLEVAAGLLEEMINFYSREGHVLTTEALIAGWEGGCPILFLVDTSDIGCVSSQRCAIGPGASSVYNAIEYQYQFEMSIDEAVSFARSAMYLAPCEVSEDSFVNRGPSVYYGGLYGWKTIVGDDVGFPPSSGTMDTEDEETSKYWEAELKVIKERDFMIDAFSWTVIDNTKPCGI